MRHSIYLLIVVIFMLSVRIAIGQHHEHDEKCRVIYTEDGGQFEDWLSSGVLISAMQTDGVYKIPVVVHVLHLGDPHGKGANISKEQIESQIQVLNEDFRRKEGTRGHNSHPVGGDAKIEFVLARSSPSGDTTSGIVRVDLSARESPPFGGNRIAIGAYYTMWNPSHYLNIWTFPGPKDFGIGEARFPVSDLPGLEDTVDYIIPGFDSLSGFPTNQVDGIAVTAMHFGATNLDSPYKFGRTATHEIGHFLGLFHVWGKNEADDGCLTDDFCEDTPPTSKKILGCPNQALACDGSKAMIENYMDYTDDDCMNIFTNDQIARMRLVLQNSPRRHSLLSSPGLSPPGPITTLPKKTGSLIRVYPNPATNGVYIEFDKYHQNNMVLTIYNMLGQMIVQEYRNLSNDKKAFLEIPPGTNKILILKVAIGNEVLEHKIVRKQLVQ